MFTSITLCYFPPSPTELLLLLPNKFTFYAVVSSYFPLCLSRVAYMSVNDEEIVYQSLGNLPVAAAENDSQSLSNQELPIAASHGVVGPYKYLCYS